MRAALMLRLLLCGSCMALTAHAAESLYKYRDAQGNLVYTDRAPQTSSGNVQSLSFKSEAKPPSIEVREVKDHEQRSLVAINECRCVVEYELRILNGNDPKLQSGSTVHQVVQPQSEKTLMTLANPAMPNAKLQWAWRAVLGSPMTQPATRVLYRAPFAPGSSYRITQAYPQLITHTSPADQYALDIALPDGTPIYAAREGLVINLQHDKFLTAASPVMLDQANMVEILHDDGTIAIYAHLHWDSVRVRPGQRVQRGDYLADSGNTGFSTGPHLHFGVMYNAGAAARSIPLQFQGPGGSAVTPQQDVMLTAY
jgi:murein DD-endopeptidase MepM/ murein hydrolase activator NlpD